MQDLLSQLSFLESRLTLLERKVERHLPRTFEPSSNSVLSETGRRIHLAFNDPGIFIAQMYPPETDQRGQEFCWVGSDGPIQFVLPVVPVKNLDCSLFLMPHPQVDFSGLRLRVNDEAAEVRISTVDETKISLGFTVPASTAPNLNVLLLEVGSVRPSEFSENTDHRLLAARFFGAEVVYT